MAFNAIPGFSYRRVRNFAQAPTTGERPPGPVSSRCGLVAAVAVHDVEQGPVVEEPAEVLGEQAPDRLGQAGVPAGRDMRGQEDLREVEEFGPGRAAGEFAVVHVEYRPADASRGDRGDQGVLIDLFAT